MANLKTQKSQHEGCRKSASYGIFGGPRTHCKIHMTTGMERLCKRKDPAWRGTKCQYEGCAKLASYDIAGEPRTHCKIRMTTGMENVSNRRCKSGRTICSAIVTRDKYDGYCTHCFRN